MDKITLAFAILLAFKSGVGLMLAFSLSILGREKNKWGNIYLSLCFWAYTLFGLYDSLSTAGFFTSWFPFAFLFNLPIFLLPFLIYSSISHYAKLDYQESKWKLLLLLPFFFRLGTGLFAYSLFDRHKLMVLEDSILLTFLIISAGMVHKRLLIHRKNIQSLFSNIEAIDLSWMYRFLLGFIFIKSMTLLISIFEGINEFIVIADLADFFVLVYLGYYAIKQREIFPRPFGQFNQSEERALIEKSRKSANLQEIEAKKAYILELIEKEKLYLNPDLSLPDLSKHLSMKTHDLSYFLNQYFDQNFYNFINRFRIEESKRILLDPDKQYLSILGVALESGFNSKTAFNTNFKKQTNLSPSAFKKLGYQKLDVRLDTNEHF